MSQTKVTAFYQKRKRKDNRKLSNDSSIFVKTVAPLKSVEPIQISVKCHSKPVQIESPRTPKRSLPSPDEIHNVSSKKKRKEEDYQSTASNSACTTEKVQKQQPTARRKLQMGQESSAVIRQDNADGKKANKLPSFASRVIKSGKLEELKEKLSKFEQTFATLKDFKANKYKVTSVIPTEAEKSSEPKLVQHTQVQESVPAYVKFHSLATAGLPSLTLPYKHKLLSEAFRCSDTVVSMLHNRKEVCTFDKLKGGVQDMTKKTFTKHHLGQIKTVYPLAYAMHIEKNSSAYINRKPGAPQYELVIVPDISNHKVHREADIPKTNLGKQNSGLSRSAFTPVTPTHLVERRNIFTNCLLNIVKRHHQKFLESLNPPVFVPIDKLTKWHPKFPLDMIPDVESSPLPELPNNIKINTAKDVLEKIRGTAGEKVENALLSVAAKQTSSSNEAPKVEKKATVTSGMLKGISMDLLQRIRARESAKVVEDMTKDVSERKRLEMMERIPELVRTLRHYFIMERRAAVSLDDAIQKIMDSCRSIINPEEVKQHIQLIADTFPKWLSIIPIRKGLFLKINRNMDINVLLQNIPS